MEQQLDVFTIKRIELMIDMATKKLQQQVDSMKESMCSMAGEINSLKSQINRMQFQPQQARVVQPRSPKNAFRQQRRGKPAGHAAEKRSQDSRLQA